MISRSKTVKLCAQLADGATGKYPQAVVMTAAGVLITTVDLVHGAAGNGYYVASYAYGGAEVEIQYQVIVYSDAGHTVVDTTYNFAAERIWFEDSSLESGGILDTISGNVVLLLEILELVNDYDFVDDGDKFYIYEKGTTNIYKQFTATHATDGRLTALHEDTL